VAHDGGGSPMSVLVAIEGVVIVLLAVLVVGLLRSHAEILRRLHQLGAGLDSEDDRPPPGRLRSGGQEFRVMPQVPSPPDREGFTAAHDLVGTGLADDAITVRTTGVEHDTVVAFLSSGCLTCRRFWDAFAEPGRLGLPAGVRLVVATKDPAEESLSVIGGLAPPGLPLVMSSQAWSDFDVPGSPYFVLVDGPSGTVRGEGTGPDWEQVSKLLGQATGDASVAAGLAANRVAKPGADASRESRIDEELLNAGVRPGDPSLYELADDPAPTER
jgi:hypothetical protein